MAQSGARVHGKCVNLYEKLNTFITKVLHRDVFDMVYPVGSIYMSANDVDPSTLFGGTWERIQDRFLLAKGGNYATLNATGGAATVSLSVSQMPRHNHVTNAHSHGTKYNGYSFVVSETTGASNKRVTAVSSGSTYVDTASTNAFHHYNATDSQSPSTKYNGGTGSSESASNGSAHENMPPYLVVNIWKRTA